MNNRMSDEKTLEFNDTEEQTSEQSAPAAEQKTESSELGVDESNNTEESDGVDYKRELERERARRKRAEDKIVKLKKTSREEEVVEETSSQSVLDEDEINRFISERLEQETQRLKADLVSDEIDVQLSQMSSNADERELIREIYENRLNKSGFSRTQIREDLMNAKILANRTSILKQNKELTRALQTKQSMETSPAFSSATRGEAKVNEEEEAAKSFIKSLRL